MKVKTVTAKKSLTKENLTGLAFITPAVVLLSIFLLVPFILTIGNCFTNYNILKPGATEFTGQKNFIKLTKDTVFIKSIINTFVFSCCFYFMVVYL